jgi:CHASE2 domain-containing sensor protein
VLIKLFQLPISPEWRGQGMSGGVERHAQLVCQLIRADQDGQAPLVPFSQWHEASGMLVWGVAGSLSSLWARSLGRAVLLHVGALAVLSSMTLGLFLLRCWLPLLPPALAWGLCSTVMTAYGAHQERQQVWQGG